jgi:putative tricarboxylic transport membrane protein
MRKDGNILAGFFFLLFGIAVAIGALQLPLGKPLDPQPGFFPLLAGVFLAGLSILHLLHAFLKRSAAMQTFGALWRPAFLIAGLGLYSLILDYAGYVLATILLAVVILRILETKPWWKIAGASLAISAGSFLLFDRLLGVTLPAGVLKGIIH